MTIIPFRPKQDLHLKVFGHHQNLKTEDQHYYQLAYESWKQVWLEVQKNEMGIASGHFYSDDFTRQDHIISLFDKKKCIGVAFMREINPHIKCITEDSSLRFWPYLLDLLPTTQSKIIMATSFSITPAYRKGEIEWKTLFLSLYLDYFSLLEANIMITAARKVKSNEKLCYQLGGEVLKKNVPFTTKSGDYIEYEIADLLFWTKKNISLSNRFLQNLRQEIWLSYIKETSYVELISA